MPYIVRFYEPHIAQAANGSHPTLIRNGIFNLELGWFLSEHILDRPSWVHCESSHILQNECSKVFRLKDLLHFHYLGLIEPHALTN